MRTRSSFAILAVAPLLVAAAPQPVRLQPSSAWVLDYAADSCKLSRAFGEGKDKTLLQFESTAPGQLSLIAIGSPLRTSLEEVPGKFLPVQDKPFKGVAKMTVDNRAVILWSAVDMVPSYYVQRHEYEAAQRKAHRGVRPPPTDLMERDVERSARQAFASAASELEIDARGNNRPVILEIGSLGAAIKMFDKCSRDSLRDWGVDPDLEDKIVRDVWAPDPSHWFSSNDYPSEMWQKSKESEVRVRLLVDAAGNPTKCTSLSHYDEPDFNKVVCDKFMKRAKFAPAELADGTKVPSYYINRVVFQMTP